MKNPALVISIIALGLSIASFNMAITKGKFRSGLGFNFGTSIKELRDGIIFILAYIIIFTLVKFTLGILGLEIHIIAQSIYLCVGGIVSIYLTCVLIRKIYMDYKNKGGK